VHASVEAGPLATPPISPVEGQCWIVGAAPADAWIGRENAIALWTAGGWRFAEARGGMQVTCLADGTRLRFDGAAWAGPGVVGTPVGGSTIDSEARNAIATLIVHLAAQGLLISG
jgi:hypothetical protein